MGFRIHEDGWTGLVWRSGLVKEYAYDAHIRTHTYLYIYGNVYIYIISRSICINNYWPDRHSVLLSENPVLDAYVGNNKHHYRPRLMFEAGG